MRTLWASPNTSHRLSSKALNDKFLTNNVAEGADISPGVKDLRGAFFSDLKGQPCQEGFMTRFAVTGAYLSNLRVRPSS